MSLYENCHNRLSAVQRTRLDQQRSRWSARSREGHTVVINMERERFLPEASFMALLNAFLEEHESIEDLKQAYALQCRGQKLRGGPIELTTIPRRLGRVITKKRFQLALRKQFKDKNLSDKQADSLLDKLSGLIERDFMDYETDISMVYEDNTRVLDQPPRIIWCTWNHEKLDDDPFAFARVSDPNIVRACLGLIDESIRDRETNECQPLLLLVYIRPNEADLYRPTIADAELYPYFSPPPVGNDAHGWTIPRPASELPIEIMEIQQSLPSRPEGLHRPFLIGCIEEVREVIA